MKHHLSFLIVVLFFQSIHGEFIVIPYGKEERPDESQWYMGISGYIKPEMFVDTRQVIADNDATILFYPAPELLDPNGSDINGKAASNMNAMETRMHTEIHPPVFCNVRTAGVIETDFSGGLTNVDRVRMRHAFATIDWHDNQVMFGQFWHPIFVDEVFPLTVSFNRGAPFDPYSRDPQFRYTRRVGDVELMVCAASQIQNQFNSDGPIGKSSTYIHNAVVPDLFFRTKFHFGEHIFGAGVGYKRLVPRLETNTGYKARESINSMAAIVFLGLKFEHQMEISIKASYLQNAIDYLSLGGYAVHSIAPVTDHRTYTNLACAAIWAEYVDHHCEWVEPAVFAGYIANMGASKTIIPDLIDAQGNVVERRVYGMNPNLAYAFRIAPRIRWFINNLTVAGELEATAAAYGKLNNQGKAIDPKRVSNYRFMFAFFYNF